MWYHPAAFALGKHDVIAAWIVCLATAAAFFGWPMLDSLIDRTALHQRLESSRVSQRDDPKQHVTAHWFEDRDLKQQQICL